MISVFACGGCGTNVAKQITDLDVEVNFIDTSTSNLKGVKSDNIFVIENIDGAGKDRSKTYEHFKDIASDVVIKFKPSASLNVVVSSLSGGSGSIIAPLVTKELIRLGHNTIVIAIDSKHSVKELDNTIKTFKTYKSISDGIKKAISIFYIENSNRKESDNKAVWFINLLSLLVNRQQTEEFDTTDLTNFLNFDRVTDNAPTISILEVNENETITPEKSTTIVSSILLTTDKHSTIKPVVPEYLSTCVVTDPQYKNDDIRVDNILGKLSIIVEAMEREIKELQDNKKINKFKELDVQGSNSDDVVL
ncbi:MAG: hypothetical protein HGA25_03490 [Clostridiales bacterium]|nr:hypothetical protein [Clostridiales bacterium]